MRGLITAVAFLTRLPVSPSWQPHEESDFKFASWYFPLIGLLLGFIAVGIFSLLQRFLPGSLTLLLTLGAGLLLTGALHEDGFADVADACGGATLERRLEIMKDSRLGSYGVMALIFMFGFKFFSWQSLDIVANKRLLAVLLLGPAWSRWIFLPLMSMVPGQAGRNGLGRFFAAPPWWWIGASGLILALLTWKMMPEKTAPLIVAVLSAGAGLGWFFRRWFGGMTGDCFGAAAVWTELSLLLAVNWGLG